MPGKAKGKKKSASGSRSGPRSGARSVAKSKTASTRKAPTSRPATVPRHVPEIEDNGERTATAPKTRVMDPKRKEFLSQMLVQKRQETMREITEGLGQRLTQDQQRRLESAMDVGDQALMDLERELGISLMEMSNRKRQLIDEALTRLTDNTYGICEECGVEISAKRLEAVPFAKLCVACQSRQELLDKIEKEEDRD